MTTAYRPLAPLDVVLGAVPLTESAYGDLVGVRVQQRLSMPTQCELHFGSGEALLATDTRRTWLTPGAAMAVSVGGQGGRLFDGDLTSVEYVYTRKSEPEILLRGYDALQRLRRFQDVAAYPNCSLVDLARQMTRSVAFRDNLRVDAPSQLSWQLLIQHQQNNLEFLVEMAAQAGAYLFVWEDCLHLFTLAGMRAQDAPVRLTLGDNLLSAQIEVNTAESCREVQAIGWAAGPAQAQRQRASETGADWSQPAGSGVRASRLGVRALLNETAVSAPQMQALAQAELERRRQGEITVWGRALGDRRLHPGAVIEIRNVALAVAGRYVITEAIHTIDGENGYVTEFNTAPPEIQPRPRCDVATLGHVTSLNDPERLGRVNVVLPAYADVDAGWMPVVYPGGGPKKGVYASPDVNDTVLVLLLRENPAQGVVLGGLYGTRGLPYDGEPREAGRHYTWTTQGGPRIRLSEVGDAIRIETHSGAAIEFDGDEIVIRAARIDFRSL